MAMRRGGGNKRRITGRAGTFAVKGVMARKYPDGMRPNEGERTKIRRTHREFKAQ